MLPGRIRDPLASAPPHETMGGGANRETVEKRRIGKYRSRPVSREVGVGNEYAIQPPPQPIRHARTDIATASPDCDARHSNVRGQMRFQRPRIRRRRRMTRLATRLTELLRTWLRRAQGRAELRQMADHEVYSGF